MFLLCVPVHLYLCLIYRGFSNSNHYPMSMIFTFHYQQNFIQTLKQEAQNIFSKDAVTKSKTNILKLTGCSVIIQWNSLSHFLWNWKEFDAARLLPCTTPKATYFIDKPELREERRNSQHHPPIHHDQWTGSVSCLTHNERCGDAFTGRGKVHLIVLL